MLLIIACAAISRGQPSGLDPVVAARYFQEAKWASDDDGGKLWGKPLYGPMMFVDPGTRQIIANQADKEGRLTLAASGNLWIGELPKEVGIANTATQWAGVYWSMVQWPLPEESASRARLLMHESWHRIQSEIGLPSEAPGNKHLDTKDGRAWLRLEWRALSLALISWGPERSQSITDALIFRTYRRSLFPGSAAEEDRMEMHEGMAEYTGIRMMGLNDRGRRSFLSGRIKVNALKPSYTLSFAYETGPAYGLLLDMKEKPWRSTLTTKSSVSDTLQDFEAIALPTNLSRAAHERTLAYDGKQVFDEEEKREKSRLEREVAFRKLLVDGPVLELPFSKPNYTYNPNEVFPLGAYGTIYPTTTIADAWGILEVKNGARINSQFDRAFVAAPLDSTRLEGDGWKLTLNPGWKVVPGERKGDFKVVKS